MLVSFALTTLNMSPMITSTTSALAAKGIIFGVLWGSFGGALGGSFGVLG